MEEKSFEVKRPMESGEISFALKVHIISSSPVRTRYSGPGY
jgi:hypothetical protein